MDTGPRPPERPRVWGHMSANDHRNRDLARLLSALPNLLLNTPRVETFLAELADLAAVIIEPPASCGIMTRYEGQLRTVVASDERATVVDAEQYGAGRGPCLEALQTGSIVEVPDQMSDPRWPGYREQAIAQGVRSSLSLPLIVDSGPVGAMNLYGFDRPQSFDPDTRHRAEIFAAQASTTLALALRQLAQAELAEQLEQALSSRTVIDQAIGILMAEQRCSADDAFAVLRTHSQNNNRKLRDVAEALVTRVSRRPAQPGALFRRPGDGGTKAEE
ncbi:GAF and ANTAR domain-containing protein [Jiangella gansuensis]|uniref:GAF and ANTAR domain-containing protein n=1 Tax=Jiangella gansuensis TaxID=281473 RepID=UPI00146FC873|nr:GAF and ANTAR domain-containing protein [Jiangella gansuensis]